MASEDAEGAQQRTTPIQTLLPRLPQVLHDAISSHPVHKVKLAVVLGVFWGYASCGNAASWTLECVAVIAVIVALMIIQFVTLGAIGASRCSTQVIKGVSQNFSLSLQPRRRIFQFKQRLLLSWRSFERTPYEEGKRSRKQIPPQILRFLLWLPIQPIRQPYHILHFRDSESFLAFADEEETVVYETLVFDDLSNASYVGSSGECVGVDDAESEIGLEKRVHHHSIPEFEDL
ncbi:hypothetical protein RJ641_028939 [Dillenia turbinata]|uniref:Uncharacterized protein n=1 Tax=Dillenia turbinata TaxID=194707 RepID=A0AAN8ZM92_9MAGN